jgi:hypothetical protein
MCDELEVSAGLPGPDKSGRWRAAAGRLRSSGRLERSLDVVLQRRSLVGSSASARLISSTALSSASRAANPTLISH